MCELEAPTTKIPQPKVCESDTPDPHDEAAPNSTAHTTTQNSHLKRAPNTSSPKPSVCPTSPANSARATDSLSEVLASGTGVVMGASGCLKGFEGLRRLGLWEGYGVWAVRTASGWYNLGLCGVHGFKCAGNLRKGLRCLSAAARGAGIRHAKVSVRGAFLLFDRRLRQGSQQKVADSGTGR